MESIVVREPRSEEWDAVHAFLLAEGKGVRIADRNYFDRLMRGSFLAIAAFAGEGEVVGFARSISDGVSNGYISLVSVREDFRRQGVATAMINRLMGDDPRLTWVLRASPESREFWGTLGFVPSTWAMERLRQAR